MSRDPTWTGDNIPLAPLRIGPGGWLRALLRGSTLVIVTFGSLAILLLLRLVERPLRGWLQLKLEQRPHHSRLGGPVHALC